MSDEGLLGALRAALRALDLAERERAAAWAFSASGLLDPGARRVAQIEAEQEVEEARETLRRAKDAIATGDLDGRSWAGH